MQGSLATLAKHSTSGETAIQDLDIILKCIWSDHEPDPFPARWIESYEQGWRAVFETATAKMAEQVEIWKSGIDSTLIFVSSYEVIFNISGLHHKGRSVCGHNFRISSPGFTESVCESCRPNQRHHEQPDHDRV